jgi:hypothetical protein
MFATDSRVPASPRQAGLLDMLAWALADDSHPKAWWAGRLGMDEHELDALLAGEGERLLRARMLRAVGEASGSRDVSRAIRGRVVEIVAGAPKASALASLALTLKRLPPWMAAEWTGHGDAHAAAPLQLSGYAAAEAEYVPTLDDLPELKAAIEEAKLLLVKMGVDVEEEYRAAVAPPARPSRCARRSQRW